MLYEVITLRALLAPEHAQTRWTQRWLQEHTVPVFPGTDRPLLNEHAVSLGLVNKVVRHLRDDGDLEEDAQGRLWVPDPESLFNAYYSFLV